MNQPDIEYGPMILIIILILVGFAAYPFAKAYLMYLAGRILKFRSLSYWKTFFCVLIGIGIMMMVQMILIGVTFRQGRIFDPQAIIESSNIGTLLSLVLVPIAEAISMFLFFRESLGKTLGAVTLTYIFIFVLIIVLFVLAVILKFLVNPGT